MRLLHIVSAPIVGILSFVIVGFVSTSPLSAAPASASLVINAGESGPRISPTLYGIFFEEINCAGDGGLYPELVRNRSFEDASEPVHWTALSRGESKPKLVLDSNGRTEGFNKRALKVSANSGQASVANDGYWGMAIERGETYELSVIARAAEGFEGPLMVTLESKDGKVYAEGKLKGLTEDWQELNCTLKPTETDPTARLVITLSGEGTVWFDFVSLFPRNTWKKRENGMRPDLAEMLAGLKPAFMRFPGGCWVEGDTMALAYRWKQTIGPLPERRTHYNIWQYYSTHGLGYHEYLQLSEDLGAEPLFVVNCGMSHRENVPMDELDPYVQDALDAIEYANGPVTSQWGALRAKNGHAKPFNLKYVEIGNENGGPAYNERYGAFYRAIKAKYPDIILIANLWGGLPKDTPIEIIDEHYYSNPGFFIQNATRYDDYDRAGPKIYVGEYAVTQGSGTGNLRGALAEAAFMTGMERNSDIVVMSSYAPLFANVNYKRWNPDLINFDSSRVYGTPSYYVQLLFAQHRPDVVIPAKLKVAPLPEKPSHGAIGLGTWNTQAEYKDIKVTRGDETLFERSAPQDLEGWRAFGGNWLATNGVLRQTRGGDDRRIIAGDPAWTDYQLSLKARKLGGAEGFLILFHVKDDNNWLWWNIGGWGNTRHAIEHCVDGGKSQLGRDASGRIETGRWYDVRVEVTGNNVKCFLDGDLVHEARITRSTDPLHVVAGRDEKTGEIVVKAVNVSDTDYATDIDVQGVKGLSSKASAIVLTSASGADENSLEQPRKVAPSQQTVRIDGPKIKHVFPANSLTVMRLKP